MRTRSSTLRTFLTLSLAFTLGWSSIASAAPPVQASSVADAPSAKEARGAETATEPAAEGAGSKFVRIIREDGETTAMEVAIATYAGKNAAGKPVEVALAGVIHIADARYYRQLNKEFERYDAVLYELIAPKGVKPPRGSGSMYSPVARMLELADQLAVIDYDRPNFIHADMSWEEMRKSMEERQESFTKLFFRMIGHSIAQQSQKKNQASENDLLLALLFSKNPSLEWKRMMSAQFEDADKAMSWLEGPNGSTLITERNKAALQVLQEQLQTDKQKIAIFYGAGHLPDMERRLESEFGLKKIGERWLAAWDMSGSKAKDRPGTTKSTEDGAPRAGGKQAPKAQ